MNKYIAFYNQKQHIIDAGSLWEATQKAREFFRVPKSKQGLLAVELAELEGKEVLHNTASVN